ncbi:MAG TPA: hypothetical protein VF590_15365 [Isosphaeraceae bacterium]|jgi:hypothetical protein
MPVIRPRRREWQAQRPRAEYVEQIAREIRGEVTTGARPVIFEIPMNGSKTYHVIVVWDEWEDIPMDERTSIVTEAYEIFDTGRDVEDAITPRITTAIGVTAGEAVQLNLLPYQVKPTIVSGLTDREDIQQKVRQAMREEGAIEFAGGPLLAFPSRPMADEALGRLTANVPEGYWRRHDE